MYSKFHPQKHANTEIQVRDDSSEINMYALSRCHTCSAVPTNMLNLKQGHGWVVVAHAFKSQQRQKDLYEYKARLVYKVSYRTATTITQRNLVFKKPN